MGVGSTLVDNTRVEEDRPRRGRPRGRWRDVAVVASALVVGFAIAALVFSDRSGPGDGGAASAPIPTPETDDVASLPAPPGPEAPLAAPADSPRGAVEAFLTAEADGDFAASYDLLSAEDRASVGSRARWVTAHADLLPIAGHRIDDVSEGDDGVVVDTLTAFRPGLDPVIGLVPGQAHVTWPAVAEDGGWRVSFGRAQVEPLYPDDARAADAARAWAESRRDCDADARRLLGTPSAGDELCGADGAVRVGQPRALDDPTSADPYVSAYGPESMTWARVVPVVGPVALDVVLAPVGERWVVIGVDDARR